MVVTQEICQELNDNEIIIKSLGNIDYFACLFEKYEKKLFQYIRQVSFVSSEEAEDILQESFIKIWRNLNEFDDHMKLSSWIYRIVHNETISYWRKSRSFGKENKVHFEDFQELIPDEPDLETGDGTNYHLTFEMINQLSLKYRECLILKFYEKKSYAEISDILKIPEGTVATRISRAKVKMKKIMESTQGSR